MAGHSKWSKVKHIKGVLDVRRGKLFSKLSKEITVAARLGGGNPDFNPRLRAAIQSAKTQSMPADNIDRAVKKGTGELGGNVLEEMIYEGYGPEGVALILEAATDNKNRTAADLRTIFSKNQGNLAASGSVSYMFHRKGQILVSAGSEEEDRILEIILGAGAEEMFVEEGTFRILTPPDKLYAVAGVLREALMEVGEQKLTFLPETTVTIEEEEPAKVVLRLCDALDDCDDILSVHANFDLPDDLMTTLQENE